MHINPRINSILQNASTYVVNFKAVSLVSLLNLLSQVEGSAPFQVLFFCPVVEFEKVCLMILWKRNVNTKDSICTWKRNNQVFSSMQIIEYRSVTSQIFALHLTIFMTMFKLNMLKKLHTPNFT